MPRFGPITRRDLVRVLTDLGFVGPYPGGNREYMVRGTVKLHLPNPHIGDIDRNFLARLLKQGEISQSEWENA